jgi:hypothetical protein
VATAEITNLVDAIAGKRAPRASLERRLALAGLGLVRALREGSLTIAEAERELFNVETYRAARRRRCRGDLIRFLEWGMELDDVQQLTKDGLEESYREMERLLLRVVGANSGKAKSRGRKPKQH